MVHEPVKGWRDSRLVAGWRSASETSHGLGRLLRGYKGKPTLVRFGDSHPEPARGYRRANLEGA